ncbi:DHA2 family efflux MFS transporter permease subunit [Amycolatopsis rifamycinica]|uniref:Multidrug transporter n=1 Tax=Amycolatopsis rifamycinica TaxID=287986 RepID=A0A066UEM2_9PSEU|nr:DHA2 family efflux MFS transporter permease subunit [Amycolatopsis rifamycinica]KDN22643.1 multidrug transporter [Amycolatopsis rifamycinica]
MPHSGPSASGDVTGAGKLDRDVLKVAAVVVLGSIMAILDTTVVNVALQELTVRFQTSFATIQWVSTGYMLALAAVIPVTGWASDRFGTKRLYLVALSVFLLGSVLAGLSWNIETLIGFRVLQGLGGGMLMPAGMTLLTRAAGPQRVGQVMALLGVPMLLGPIGGPILGGWLVDTVSWRWIFFINVPIGLVALVATTVFLPQDEPERADRFDFPGMLMLSPGLALLLYGVANVPGAGGVSRPEVWLPAGLGAVLVAGFVLRATRIPNPLIDLGLFRDRTFSVAVLAMAFFSVSFFGVMLLFPSYFLLVRGESALSAGLLMAPQGIGAMLTMPVAGKLADRIGPGRVILPGIVAIAAGLALFAGVGAGTAYWQLLAALFVVGLGVGAAMMPIMVAALRTLRHREVARASTATNIIQQMSGAIGSAVMSIILAGVLAAKFGVPTSQGQLAAGAALADPATHDAAAAAAADSFGTAFTWGLVFMVVSAVPAALLLRKAPLRDELVPDVVDVPVGKTVV